MSTRKMSMHPALPTTASPALQGARKDGFGENVVERDMPELCKCSSLDSCQKIFLWAHKEVDLAPKSVVGRDCVFLLSAFLVPPTSGLSISLLIEWHYV